MEELRKVAKQAIIWDVVFLMLNFIVTPLVVLFTFICFTEENGIIDNYISIFGDKSTDDGWEYILLIVMIGVTCLIVIILGIVLMNNIMIYIKLAKDLKLLHYIDVGDVNRVIEYGRKSNLLIKMSLNPFFIVTDSKMKAALDKYQQFNYLTK